MRRKSSDRCKYCWNALAEVWWDMCVRDLTMDRAPSTPPSISTIHGMRWNIGSRVSSLVCGSSFDLPPFLFPRWLPLLSYPLSLSLSPSTVSSVYHPLREITRMADPTRLLPGCVVSNAGTSGRRPWNVQWWTRDVVSWYRGRRYPVSISFDLKKSIKKKKKNNEKNIVSSSLSLSSWFD